MSCNENYVIPSSKIEMFYKLWWLVYEDAYCSPTPFLIWAWLYILALSFNQEFMLIILL